MVSPLHCCLVKTTFQLNGGATWLNFMATIGQAYGAHPQERLPDPRALAAWLGAVDLSPRRAPSEADLAGALALRGALRELALAHVDQRAAPAGAAAELIRRLPSAVPDLDAGRDAVRFSPPADCAEALGRIALQAAMHLSGPERTQLRVCAEHDCRWVFADPTGRRRWCPSPACANRGRVRAHRARRKSAEDVPG